MQLLWGADEIYQEILQASLKHAERGLDICAFLKRLNSARLLRN